MAPTPLIVATGPRLMDAFVRLLRDAGAMAPTEPPPA
jgi:hypothetical protein